MIKLNAFITDDEAMNRETLSLLLTEYCPSVEVVGTAADIQGTLKGLEENDVDILFLDIQLGSTDTGFDLLDMKKDLEPAVVFITSYTEHAVKAFQYGAVHYLVKPVNRKDLVEVVTRVKARHQLQVKEWQKQFLHTATARIALGDMNVTELVKPDDIIFLEAKGGSYTSFTLEGKREIVQSKGLRFFEEMLQDYPQFIKVHRSYLVNKVHIKSFLKESGSLKLSDGSYVPVSGKVRDLKDLLE